MSYPLSVTNGMKCHSCARELVPNEAVIRVGALWRDEYVSICVPCGLRTGDAPGVGVCYWHPPKRCGHCNRPVFKAKSFMRLPGGNIGPYQYSPSYLARPIFCSGACQKEFYKQQARQRRDLPAQACVFCGKQFDPKRSDSKYCSGACK